MKYATVYLPTLIKVETGIPQTVDVCGEALSWGYDDAGTSCGWEEVVEYRRTLYFGNPGTEHADVWIWADGHGLVRAGAEVGDIFDDCVYETQGDPDTVCERIREAAKALTEFVEKTRRGYHN